MFPRAKEQQEPVGSGRGREGSPLELLEEACLADTFTSDLCSIEL